jgi:hypothetical protein
VLPLVIGFAVLSAGAMLVSRWAEGGARQRSTSPLADADTTTS